MKDDDIAIVDVPREMESSNARRRAFLRRAATVAVVVPASALLLSASVKAVPVCYGQCPPP